MLGAVALPPKQRPDVIDALVVLTAAGHGRAVVLTSDPEDIAAYAAHAAEGRDRRRAGLIPQSEHAPVRRLSARARARKP